MRRIAVAPPLSPRTVHTHTQYSTYRETTNKQREGRAGDQISLRVQEKQRGRRRPKPSTRSLLVARMSDKGSFLWLAIAISSEKESPQGTSFIARVVGFFSPALKLPPLPSPLPEKICYLL